MAVAGTAGCSKMRNAQCCTGLTTSPHCPYVAGADGFALLGIPQRLCSADMSELGTRVTSCPSGQSSREHVRAQVVQVHGG